MRMTRADLDAFLAGYPRRTAARWSDGPEGVVVEVEKASNPLGRSLLAWMRAPATARAVLDPVGSDAWRLADGSRTVSEIASGLVERHGAAAEPGGPRAVAFYAALRSRGLVQMAEAPFSVPASGPTGFSDSDGYRAATCPRCGGGTRLAGAPPLRFKCPHCSRVVRG